MHLFSSNHVKLLNACYPPNSALPGAGPDYSPNSHELSRLTYYASNHPGKLTKLGGELEKRLKSECRRAKAGHIRSRASLLISLSIFRSLAMECRRDIGLLCPSLLSSLEDTLQSVPSDLEVVARVASVFTAWTTYTNGQLIGADSAVTQDYLSILRQFATLSVVQLPDQEDQNRRRLIGLAALTGAISSEALYNDSSQFRAQVAIILRPIISVILQTDMRVLSEQCTLVKDSPTSPYLAEFRTRPPIERRAASIHIHVDGDKGPSTQDVSDAALRGLFLLLGHANGSQLGFIMQSSFDSLDEIQGWSNEVHCRWLAQVITEWAQYQYRYVVPTWLVERLAVHQDVPTTTSMHQSLLVMANTVFSSSTALINLSSSDILSNLANFLLRRVAISGEEPILKSVVDCIASLGCHVYYSDQIQDMAAELINKLVIVEAQHVLNRDTPGTSASRATAIQYLLASLFSLIRIVNTDERNVNDNTTSSRHKRTGSSLGDPKKDTVGDDKISRRTRVPPDVWQDTLSLLCHSDSTIRSECATALNYYITHEMPKHGETADIEDTKHFRGLASHSFRHAINNLSPASADATTKFLNAIHGFLFILATSPSLSNNATTPKSSRSRESHGDTGSPPAKGSTSQRSTPISYGPRARKDSLVGRLLSQTSMALDEPPSASEQDYSNILQVLLTVQRFLPIRGLLSGLPMLLALDATVRTSSKCTDPVLAARLVTLKTVIANVWLSIGQVWKVQTVITLAQTALSELSTIHPASVSAEKLAKVGIVSENAVAHLTASRTLQEVMGSNQEHLLNRFSNPWTPDLAFRDATSSPSYETSFRGDGVTPLLKISPALMHIENISLHSLARSTRGLGVTDLREALEGRNSMSNPALAQRAPSLSTLDHTSSFADPSLRLTQTRSRTRTKKRMAANGAGEVRDVLSKLGINKNNNNLLKASLSPPA